VKPEKPSLYVVPTPIGNLKDITLRALEILRTVDTILAEDTRKSGILLKHFEINKPLQRFHIFNEHQILVGLIKRMAGGEIMALVTDAGTPGFPTPGFCSSANALNPVCELSVFPVQRHLSRLS